MNKKKRKTSNTYLHLQCWNQQMFDILAWKMTNNQLSKQIAINLVSLKWTLASSLAWLCLSNKCFFVDPYLACEDLQDSAEGKHTRAHIYISVSLPALFSEKVRNMSPDEIRIPPEPPGRCSSQLQVGTPPVMYCMIKKPHFHCKAFLVPCTLLISKQCMLLLTRAGQYFTSEATVMSANQTREEECMGLTGVVGFLWA